MADVLTGPDILAAIEIAADPRRFALLKAAVLDEGFAASEAAEIAGCDPSSGTVRTVHARALERAGLLERSGHPIRYEVTALGRSVYRALTAALRELEPPGATSDDVAVVVLLDRHTYESLALESADLTLTLQRRLKRTRDTPRAFRLVRVKGQ